MSSAHLANGHHAQLHSRAPPTGSPSIMSANRYASPSPGSEADRAKMEAFRKVKPTCVSLMAIAVSPPTSHSAHAGLIDTLNKALSSVPPAAFTPSMINYVLFPVTQILRHHDPLSLPDLFLESAFRLLTLVVGAWKVQPGGMDVSAWEQLWRFTTSSIAPRVVDSGKGKGKEVGQEVQLQAVALLDALLSPTVHHPHPAMLEKVSSPKSPLMPTLFQTITLLLALISPTPPHSALQLSALKLVRSIITTYLPGQHSVLASLLPGTISSVSRLFANGSLLKGEVASRAAGLAEEVIVQTLWDTDLQKLGILRAGVDDLEELAEDWEARCEVPPSPTSSASSLGGKDPFPPLTKSYLDFTSAQLFTTIRPILSSLASHTSHLARTAAASLAHTLLSRCHLSLPQLAPFALSLLLRLSRDDSDPVRDRACEHLRALLSDSNGLELGTALIDLLGEAINALPRLILAHQETKVLEAASLLTAIADSTASHATTNPIADLLGPRGKVERWGWALLDCLEFGRPSGWSTMSSSAARSAEKGWMGGMLGSSLPLLLEGKGGSTASFPELPLRYIESEGTIKAVKTALVSLGSAGGETALHAVEHFVLLAKAKRTENISKAVSALWVAQLLLEGVAQGQEEGVEGKVGKFTRKMAREITRIIVAMEEAEDDDEEPDVPVEEEESEALIPVERTKGLDVVTTLLERPSRPDTHAAKETQRLHAQAQRVLLTSLSLSTLATTSKILSSSFRPLLLTVLYTILAQLASPHAIVNTFAETALSQVAYNTGYASVQNLILDNVDYVINVVSQRLTPARLSPTAPLVLIAMIRLTRSEIVPLVHDIVDEIFDALDDYHGYEVLASGLLAVLVTLVDVMSDDVSSQEISSERKQKLAELNRLGKPPHPQDDFANFTRWWEDRQRARDDEVRGILDRAPEHAWGKNAPSAEGQPDPEQDAPMDEPEEKPTRSQEITTQILDKSLNFLSHRSPFLRARILSLISSAIPVLAMGNREADLLPLVDRSWGIILLRLDDPLPYVVTEAAEVIAGLCAHVGDFMSRRVLDHAWPKLKKIMASQQNVDARSALARKGAVGTTSQWTVSHRLHLAVLAIATYVAREVPVDDAVLWDIMVLFRPFIDRRAHEGIQAKAGALYVDLGRRDADALWVVLTATTDDGTGVWGYLRDEKLEIHANAETILHDL